VGVGRTFDVVGQAGSPRQVSVFQKLDTLMLRTAEERAELADDTLELFSPIFEGFVIIRKTVMDGTMEQS
jgi:hypothetical protein